MNFLEHRILKYLSSLLIICVVFSQNIYAYQPIEFGQESSLSQSQPSAEKDVPGTDEGVPAPWEDFIGHSGGISAASGSETPAPEDKPDDFMSQLQKEEKAMVEEIFMRALFLTSASYRISARMEAQVSYYQSLEQKVKSSIDQIKEANLSLEGVKQLQESSSLVEEPMKTVVSVPAPPLSAVLEKPDDLTEQETEPENPEESTEIPDEKRASPPSFSPEILPFPAAQEGSQKDPDVSITTVFPDPAVSEDLPPVEISPAPEPGFQPLFFPQTPALPEKQPVEVIQLPDAVVQSYRESFYALLEKYYQVLKSRAANSETSGKQTIMDVIRSFSFIVEDAVERVREFYMPQQRRVWNPSANPKDIGEQMSARVKKIWPVIVPKPGGLDNTAGEESSFLPSLLPESAEPEESVEIMHEITSDPVVDILLKEYLRVYFEKVYLDKDLPPYLRVLDHAISMKKEREFVESFIENRRGRGVFGEQALKRYLRMLELLYDGSASLSMKLAPSLYSYEAAYNGGVNADSSAVPISPDNA